MNVHRCLAGLIANEEAMIEMLGDMADLHREMGMDAEAEKDERDRRRVFYRLANLRLAELECAS